MATEKSAADLQAELTQANADKEKLVGELKERNDLIEEMQTQINEQSEAIKSGKSNLTVTVDKKKFEIRVPGKITFKGKSYTAQDIQKNKAVAEEMVKKGASFLKQIEK